MKLGDVLGFLPFLAFTIAIPIAITVIHLFGCGWTKPTTINWIFGLVPLSLAILVAILNAHLAFIRPWIYRRKYNNMDDYKWISGLSGIGSILVALSLISLPISFVFGIVLLLVYFLDVAGLPVFVYCVIVYELLGFEPKTSDDHITMG